jgi:hypothetical protein
MRGSGIFVVARNWDQLTRCMVSARIMPRRSSQLMRGNLADGAVATVFGGRRSCLAAHGPSQREASSSAMRVVGGLRNKKLVQPFVCGPGFLQEGKVGVGVLGNPVAVNFAVSPKSGTGNPCGTVTVSHIACAATRAGNDRVPPCLGALWLLRVHQRKHHDASGRPLNSTWQLHVDCDHYRGRCKRRRPCPVNCDEIASVPNRFSCIRWVG